MYRAGGLKAACLWNISLTTTLTTTQNFSAVKHSGLGLTLRILLYSRSY
jgi:hypothetical protein